MKDLMIADRADVVVVDDQVENLQLLVHLLSPQFNVHPFPSGDALYRYLVTGGPVDLILLDVVMPPPDGYEICTRLRAMPELAEVPIVFLTGLNSIEDESHGLALGAVDYITKPFSPQIVLARVGHHVRLGRALRLIIKQNEYLDQRVAERTAELASKNAELMAALTRVAQTQDVTIVAFSTLAEARDNETGGHIHRTKNYVHALAKAIREFPDYARQLDDETLELIVKSAPLHDIGKVAIPDRILLKPGRLNREEFEIMKTHTTHGHHAIEIAEASLANNNTFLFHAREIAYGHHEKWDGSGYPQGIAGTAIPLSARLMAVADVYDALISRRVYKPGMSHVEALKIIAAGKGTHFDPLLVEVFLTIEKQIRKIAEKFSDGAFTG